MAMDSRLIEGDTRGTTIAGIWDVRKSINRTLNLGNVEEMTQRLRALATLTKDQGLGLNTHMVAHSWQWLQFQGTQIPFLASASTSHTHGTHT